MKKTLRYFKCLTFTLITIGFCVAANSNTNKCGLFFKNHTYYTVEDLRQNRIEPPFDRDWKPKREFSDLDSEPLILKEQDFDRGVKIFISKLRPEFALIAIPFDKSGVLLGIVPRKNLSKGQHITKEQLYDQQVVQWQLWGVKFDNIYELIENRHGRVFIVFNERTRFGRRLKFDTSLATAEEQSIMPVAYNEIIAILRHQQQETLPLREAFWSKLFPGFYESQNISISGPHLINGLSASRNLLDAKNVIKRGNHKLIHREGVIFSGMMTVDNRSEYSGDLAPGSYHVIGRLSSGMKDLEYRNEDGSAKTNSMAISLLIFRTEHKKETPGIVMFQDSLLPVFNEHLQSFSMTNHPHFKFKPTNFREALEQGFTIFGVALASFLKKSDSARGLQANTRSLIGAAGNGVDLGKGETIRSPLLTQLDFNASTIPTRVNNFEKLMRESDDISFQLSVLNERLESSPIAEIRVDEIFNDNHQIQFPHGLSGAIGPGLKAFKSPHGNKGLLIYR